MHKIELSDAAKGDIADIAANTFSRYGQKQVSIYMDAIYERLSLLAEYPNLGHKRSDLPENFKAYPAEMHVIVYQVKNGIVYIARILHGSMAFERHEIE